MAAATIDLVGDYRILGNAEYSFSLTINDSTGAAVDLTGSQVFSQIRKKAGSPVLAEFTVSIPTPTNGEVFFSLPGSVTVTLPGTTDASGNWAYDVLWVKPDGSTERPVEGAVEVDPAITVES
jgi:hypothetical protein